MSVASEYLQLQRESTEDMVRQHAPLVRRIAYHLMGRLPSSVDVDDLVQAGMIGLLEAARNYATDRSASFETYAGIRIRGAMLDELRKTDWTPRSVHRKLREVTEVVRQIENETGADAIDAEVIRRMGITAQEYHQILADATSARLLSLTAPDDDEGGAALDVVDQDGLEPQDRVEQEGMREALIESISGLPEREQLVMSLYYEQELNLKEIGAVLGVTESRVCQIHGQALVRLPRWRREWGTGSGEGGAPPLTQATQTLLSPYLCSPFPNLQSRSHPVGQEHENPGGR
jgi:RNA polymerase sigma factor for flagellar operon FliA